MYKYIIQQWVQANQRQACHTYFFFLWIIFYYERLILSLCVLKHVLDLTWKGLNTPGRKKTISCWNIKHKWLWNDESNIKINERLIEMVLITTLIYLRKQFSYPQIIIIHHLRNICVSLVYLCCQFFAFYKR